jgi:hypothetical protein
MSGVTASWALAQTVDGAFKIARDALIAASNDNIQAPALVSCERFGATLAISTLTRTKIEAMIRQQSKTPLQNFLLAKIGYAKGTSVDAISKTGEGIRFLSLATALIATSNTFDAARALEKMINDTAEDKELSPGMYQLKDILDVLEPRLNRARFLDEVVGFQSLFLPVANKALTADIAMPGPEAICELVKSFRELSRIGDEETQSLKISVGPFAAWVSAFARWSVEVPPRIYYETEEALIIDQPGSQVRICISQDPKYERNIEIETIYRSHSINKVINAIVDDNTKPDLVTGMVSLETHAHLTLREFQLNDDLGLRTCKQVLPYALQFIKSKFSTKLQFHSSTLGTISTLHSINPFPDDEDVAAVMARYLGEDLESLKPLEEGCKLGDLALVRLWIDNHKSFLERDPAEEFFGKLSYIVADILALSLMVAKGSPTAEQNTLLLMYVPRRTLSPLFAVDSQWREYVQDMFRVHELQNGKGTRLEPFGPIEHVMNWALKLVGHDVGKDIASLNWVASSFKGQILLPNILLADEVPPIGFACLSYFPGILMLGTKKDRPFARILSKGTSFANADINDQPEISAQLNLFPKEAIKWELSSKTDYLELGMGWTFNKNNQRPLNIIRALMGSMMMARCSHSADGKISVHERPALLAPGSNRLLEMNRIMTSQIAVYPLYGSEDLKLLALASMMDMRPPGAFEKPLALINRGACMDCLLGVCSLIDCGYVVL